MLEALFRKLFGSKPVAKSTDGHGKVARAPVEPATSPGNDRVLEQVAPRSLDPVAEARVVDLPRPVDPVRVAATHRPARRASLPIDLDIGLDIGTSCTKVVVGDREANRQRAIPLQSGTGLKSYLLPTRVFIKDGTYSLQQMTGAELKRDLKMRLMLAARNGAVDHDALCDLSAFAALVIRRAVDHFERDLKKEQPDRYPIWHLNVGLPSGGGGSDQFAAMYRRLVTAAIGLAAQDKLTDRPTIEHLLDSAPDGDAWIPSARLNTFPEAGAQLASLILSPHRPLGCLLVVDVGAGTLDVSTLRVGGDETNARCTIHCSSIAPLGVHYLQMARLGEWTTNGVRPEALARLPDDDGVTPLASKRMPAPPAEFVESCKAAILPTVTRYRLKLRAVHQSPAFRPWSDGLRYVLSGGGHRDGFYQQLLQRDLDCWLTTVVSEWDPTAIPPRRAGLKLRKFPPPHDFKPKSLLPHFDRFSVAHGLSLGPDGLMELKDVSS